MNEVLEAREDWLQFLLRVLENPFRDSGNVEWLNEKDLGKEKLDESEETKWKEEVEREVTEDNERTLAEDGEWEEGQCVSLEVD